ncbi:MAG TPA: four helix bundle protein [Vicinamibacteria bacterium]|nr:four helix bundle protein [Vicinamibacteria bacterium]
MATASIRRSCSGHAESIPAPHTDARIAAPYLDRERLDCYRVAVEFQVLAAGLARKPRLGSLRDQLDRASVSIVLNIAIGAGRTTGPDKALFFAIVRGSATVRRQSWICASLADCRLRRSIATPAVSSFASSR